jgi:hypothetical protein
MGAGLALEQLSNFVSLGFEPAAGGESKELSSCGPAHVLKELTHQVAAIPNYPP